MALTKGQQLISWILGTIVATGAAGSYVITTVRGIVTEARAEEIMLAQLTPVQQKLFDMDLKRERGEITTQLQIARHRISYLAGKSARSTDEEEELASLRATVADLDKRLRELNQANR